MAGFVAVDGNGRIADQSFARMNPSGLSWVARPEGNFMTGDYLPGYGRSGAQRRTTAQATAQPATTSRVVTRVPASGISRVAGGAPGQGGGANGGWMGYLRNARPVAGSNNIDAGRLGAGGVSWAAVRPAQISTGDVLKELESQALSELGLGGRLSEQEERSAQQAARGAFAARGMAMGNPAVAAEVLARDEFARARQAERRAFAGGVSEMAQRQDMAQAELDQGAAIENARGQLQAQLANVQDQIRVAIANQDDARARVLANQAEQLSRDIQYADARLRQGGLDIQAGQLALDRERAADQSQQWRSELSSRESLAGQDAGLRRELASMDIAAGARRDAASEAAAANDFYRNRTEANRIDRNNWNRFGGISGLGMGSNIRQSPRNFGGVSAPRRLGGFGFVVREPAGGAGGFGDEPWLRDPRFVAKR